MKFFRLILPIMLPFIGFQFSSLYAQNINKVYPVSGKHSISKLFETSNGYDEFGISTVTDAIGNPNQDLLFVKLDFCGTIISTLTYEDLGVETLINVFRKKSGNYSIIGMTTNYSYTNGGIMAFEITQNGTIIKSSIIKRSNNNNGLRTYPIQAVQSIDGGYLNGAWGDQSILTKLDSNLNVMWFTEYGGTGTGNKLIELPSGNIITCYDSDTDIGNGTDRSAFFMKLDAKGNILSTNRLSNKDKSLWCFYGDYGPNSIYSDNYCYFIMATSLLNPFFDPDFDHNVLLKTDTNLNPIWAKRYSHPSDTRTKLYSIKVINNDIYLCGKGVTSGEGFLSKIDTSGSLLWTKSIPKGDYVSLAPRNKSTFIPIISITFLSNGNILLFSGVENNNDNIFPILLKSDTSSNLKGCETFISPLNVSPISLTTGSFNHPPKNNKFITWSKNITSRDITQNFRDTSICPWEQRDTTICNGDSLKISGQFYKVAGVYPDSFLNIHGCDSITLRNLMISNDQSPQVDLGNDTTLCDRDQITIQNRISSTLDKQWHDGSSNASYVASSPGEYWLMEQNGCGETRDTIIIGLEPNPSISLGNDTSICEGEQLRLIAQTDGVRVIWNDLSIGTTMDIDQGGTYWAISESSKGCKNSDTIDVELIDCEDFELRMPNVFTPNGDDLNETFKPVLNKGLDYLIMSIYNRWGEKIYETSDAQKGWDGIYRGKDVPDGTYFWLLEYENPKNNQMKYLNGTVTLIR